MPARWPPHSFARRKSSFDNHVELLLRFALHIFAARRTEIAADRTLRHSARDRLARSRHIEDQRIEVAGRLRMPAALFDQELRQGGAIGEHGPQIILPLPRCGPQQAQFASRSSRRVSGPPLRARTHILTQRLEYRCHDPARIETRLGIHRRRDCPDR